MSCGGPIPGFDADRSNPRRGRETVPATNQDRGVMRLLCVPLPRRSSEQHHTDLIDGFCRIRHYSSVMAWRVDNHAFATISSRRTNPSTAPRASPSQLTGIVARIRAKTLPITHALFRQALLRCRVWPGFLDFFFRFCLLVLLGLMGRMVRLRPWVLGGDGQRPRATAEGEREGEGRACPVAPSARAERG